MERYSQPPFQTTAHSPEKQQRIRADTQRSGRFPLSGLQTEAPNWNMEKYIRKNSSYFSLSVVLLRLQKGGDSYVQSK